jgi:hypothetical protein
MKLFINGKLKLNKSVNKGDTASLLSLFDTSERFERFEALTDADEGDKLKVSLGELGEAELKLGADIEKGNRKSIMTLFWYDQRGKLFDIKGNAAAGKIITLKMWKI